jgi:quercetin dioxygenase-like cupin family protein
MIPPDDPRRTLVLTNRDDPALGRVFLAGDTYTILVTGDQTAGRYCLIDMDIPPGGGPPPHRHDFEEMFTVLEGAVEFTFRGEATVVRAGETVNIPANAPHFFRNAFAEPARMLCLCTPAGQDEFFLRVGVPVGDRTSPPPQLSEAEQAERRALAAELADTYRSEFLVP